MSRPSLLSVILACACLAGLGILTVIDMADGPGTERQERIAPTPTAPQSARGFIRLFTDARFYVANRYAMKDQFVTWNGQVKIGLMGHSPAPEVAFGRNGFLFLNTADPIAIAQGQDRLVETETRAWRSHFKTARDSFEAKGIAYAYVMGPNKHSVYPDLLPHWLTPAPSDQTVTADIAKAVDGVLMAPFDSRAVLQQARARDPEQLLYHPTDTHWTEWGAAIVLDRTLAALGVPSDLPAIVETDLPRSGDMARMIGQQQVLSARAPVLVTNYTCVDGNGNPVEITTIDPLAPGRLTCGSPQGRPERIVVFHDSFGLPAIPYLAGRFQTVEFISSDKADPARAALLGADIALQIIVERKLRQRRPSYFLATPDNEE